MKAKSYKLKYIPSEEELTATGFREGGSWIKEDAKVFKVKYLDFELAVSVCFSDDRSEWDDFNNVLVLDEDFGQPYTAFYGKNYKQEITDFPVLEYCIEKYNEFLGSFAFLEEV